MKINVYTVDFETPRWLRRMIAYVVPIALVCGAGVAYATVQHTFQSNEVLKAADLNANFTDLDARLGVLEAAPKVISAGGSVGKEGSQSTDTIYDGANLKLDAGTWLVTGFATLKNSTSDEVGLGLYDQTHGKDISGSVGFIHVTSPGVINAGFGHPTSSRSLNPPPYVSRRSGTGQARSALWTTLTRRWPPSPR